MKPLTSAAVQGGFAGLNLALALTFGAWYSWAVFGWCSAFTLDALMRHFSGDYVR